MANEYLIQNTTLTAIANAIRGKLGESNYTLNEGLLGLEEGTLITPAVVSYVEFVDYNGGYDGVQTDDGAPDSFGWYGYIADNNGVNTLVLYKNDPGSGYQGADTLEPFFHVGRAEVDGAEYDKWQKIEFGDNNEFLWDSAAKKYIYTNIITIAPSDAIGPLDMPAKIMSISGGEDLSAELAAQDELIADIKTALEGKAGGGDTSEPPMLALVGYNNTGENMTVHYLTYENEAFTYRNDVITPNASQGSFYCVDKSLVYIATKSGYSGDYVGGQLTYVAGGDNYCVFYINSESSDSNEPTFDFS